MLTMVPLVQAASMTGSSYSASGYAAYSIQANMNGTTRAVSVNESITPSSSVGESIITLAVQGTSSNFTYSRMINSSSALFPYMPGISNQNYSYTSKNYTMTARISQQGPSQMSFQGKPYTLTNYMFWADISSTNGSKTIIGSI